MRWRVAGQSRGGRSPQDAAPASGSGFGLRASVVASGVGSASKDWDVDPTGRGDDRVEGVRLTALSVAEAMRGRLVAGRAGREIRGFSIDSRSLTPGDLFFAIHGERFDGHRFVGAALGAGACGVVLDDLAAAPTQGTGESPVVIAVDDTVRALQALGHDVRRASGAKVVGSSLTSDGAKHREGCTEGLP